MRGALAILLTVGCSDNGLKVHNALPEAVITTFRDGDQAPEGLPTAVHGVVTDVDDPEEELLTTWLVDGDVACEPAAPDSYGATWCEVTLGLGGGRISLEVVDPHQGTGVAFVDLDVVATAPPVVTIDAPTPDGAYTSGSLIVLEGTVSDAEEPADALAVQWTSSVDGVLDTSPADTYGYAAAAATLSEGEHFIELSATDSAGKIGTDNVVITVGPANEPPSCAVFAPSAGAVVSQGAAVALEATVSDAESPAAELTAAWSSDVDGALGAAPPSPTGEIAFSWSPLSLGAHTLTLTVSDPDGDDGACSVDVVVNGAPTAPTVSITPDPATTVDALAAVIDAPAVDPDGDPVSYSYRWWADGVEAKGYTTSVVPAIATTRGELWRVEVTATDGLSEGPPGAAEREIGNLAPTVTDVVVLPDPAYAGDTLTCGWSFADGDADADQSTAEWTLNGNPAGTGPTLAAAVVYADVAVCTVTPFDGVDTGPALTDDLTVSNSPPEVLSVAVSPSPLYTDHLAVSAVTATDPDLHLINLVYAWTVDGSPAGSGPSLDGTAAFSRDQTVELVVTADDGIDLGVPMSSGPIVVANTPPTAPAIHVDPTSPMAGGDDLVCLVDIASTDADLDPVSYEFAWDVDGATHTAPVLDTWLPGDTVPGTETSGGELWTCTVTPTDGTDDGPAVSDAVLVERGVDRVFVTSGTWSGELGGLSGADALCQEAAEDAGLGGTWVAFLSGTGASAASRIGEGPYERLDGVTIAADKASLLDGGLDAPLNITELGTASSKAVFTGSIADGTTGPHTSVNGLCDEWVNGCGVCYGNHFYAQSGQSGETGDDWVDWGWQFCSSSSGLYCFEI